MGSTAHYVPQSPPNLCKAVVGKASQTLYIVEALGTAGLWSGYADDCLNAWERACGGCLEREISGGRPRPRPVRGTFGGAELKTRPRPTAGALAQGGFCHTNKVRCALMSSRTPSPARLARFK
jgi:hypothetical protein